MTHASGRRRASFALAVAAAAVTALAGTVGAQSPAASPAAPTGLKATYVSSGPIGANPFLQLIAQGLTQGGTEYGVETKVIESSDTSALEDNLRAAIEDGNDLIVANSFDSVDAITKLAAEYPDQKWALVDTTIDNPNVRGLVFREHEGAYLVGAIFGLLATGQYAGFPQSDVIGSVGAIDLPFIRRWYVGFEAGVKAVNPDAKRPRSHGARASTTRAAPRSWRWPSSLRAPSTSSRSRRPATAASSRRPRTRASSPRAWTPTSGPSTRRTSSSRVVKRTDLGVKDAIRDLAAGTFTGGVVDYGLSQDGVGPAFIVLPDSPPASVLPQAVQDQVRELAAKIISGEIVVPDYLAQPAPSGSPAASSAP